MPDPKHKCGKQLVLDALERLMRGRTSILIGHRLATIRRADVILVLDGGHVVESGRRRDLASRSGLYAGLYELQSATPQ